ncbi:MAG: aminotransferase class I/II-fold pyridoxal phosphate-dependent enzyme [Acidobacteriota bacterium]
MQLDDLNRTLAADAPVLHRALSPLGRRAIYPHGIPAQAAEARQADFNGTIGQITDGRGGALPLPTLAAAYRFDDAADAHRAFLYAPVDGLPEMRRAWQRWQRRQAPAGASVDGASLPITTIGLTHGLSLVADLFTGPGRTVVSASPFWGNYRQTFELRTGAELRTAPSYDRDGRFDPRSIGRVLASLPAGEPAVVILNFPSNPGGYMPDADERAALRDGLLAAADDRPIVAVCDDAYAGMVFDDAVPAHSLFWDLLDAHANLCAIKVDGATKELAYFGGRVGFLTFGVASADAVAALESKIKSLVRATVGSPCASSQAVMLQLLRDPDRTAREVEIVRSTLAARCATLNRALADLDPALLRPLPCNAGCFSLIALAPDRGLEAEALRRHLLAHEGTGLVAIGSDHVRIAFCSVAEGDLPALVTRMARGAAALAA